MPFPKFGNFLSPRGKESSNKPVPQPEVEAPIDVEVLAQKHPFFGNLLRLARTTYENGNEPKNLPQVRAIVQSKGGDASGYFKSLDTSSDPEQGWNIQLRSANWNPGSRIIFSPIGTDQDAGQALKQFSELNRSALNSLELTENCPKDPTNPYAIRGTGMQLTFTNEDISFTIPRESWKKYQPDGSEMVTPNITGKLRLADLDNTAPETEAFLNSVTSDVLQQTNNTVAAKSAGVLPPGTGK